MKNIDLNIIVKEIEKKYQVNLLSIFSDNKDSNSNCDKCMDCRDWEPDGNCKNGWDE